MLDEKIIKVRSLIDSLKLYKRGFINSYIEHNEGAWPLIRLSEILHERSEFCEKNGTYPHATLSKEGVSEKTERYDRDYLVASEDKKYKVTRLNDLCYNPANLKFGVICLNTFGAAIFSPIYITFEISKNHIPGFIGAMLMRPDFINRALKYQQGTVYERMAVSPDDMLSMYVRLPSKEEQERVASAIAKLETVVKSEETTLENLYQLKKALLRELII